MVVRKSTAKKQPRKWDGKHKRRCYPTYPSRPPCCSSWSTCLVVPSTYSLTDSPLIEYNCDMSFYFVLVLSCLDLSWMSCQDSVQNERESLDLYWMLMLSELYRVFGSQVDKQTEKKGALCLTRSRVIQLKLILLSLTWYRHLISFLLQFESKPKQVYRNTN